MNTLNFDKSNLEAWRTAKRIADRERATSYVDALGCVGKPLAKVLEQHILHKLSARDGDVLEEALLDAAVESRALLADMLVSGELDGSEL